MRLSVVTKWRGITLVTACLLTLLLGLRFAPKPSLKSQIPHSTAIYANDGSLLRLTLATDDQYQLWVDLPDIAPNAVEAVKLYEDRYFNWHLGVNPVAMARGAWRTARGQAPQGASTISMQLARVLYDVDSRSIRGKLEQIAYAIWLELRYTKAEIFEAYLNVVPYGGNIKGIATASRAYFNIPAKQLNLTQAITLAVIPQNPNKRLLKTGATHLQNARLRLWQAWLQQHPADEKYSGDIASVLQPQASKLPFLAPHFTDAILALRPVEPNIHTGLDLHAQRSLERMMTAYLQNNRNLGINNASAMLLDARTMRVKALVGSADYYNSAIDGQVNGTAAKRSPGSTLKPFIYALAIDQGIITPASILKDVPTSFGPYTPENFDGRFIGPISATEALIRSRNLPAVTLSAKISQPNLYAFLKNAGVANLQNEAHYGLALTLGGGELSMDELVSLYAMLANRGVYRPLSLTNQPLQTGNRMLSEEAAFIVLDMLAQNQRPDTGMPDKGTGKFKQTVAWKTGTSWGFHDAWTIGVVGHDVLAVWVGNFDGAANPAFVGIKTAAPLFFQMLDSLRYQRLLTPYSAVDALPPRNLSKVDVCVASGDLPNAYCPNTAPIWFIPGKSPIKVSTLHRPVYFNAQGQVVCSASLSVRQEVYEFWSSDMLKLFRDAGMPRRAPPTANCAQSAHQSESPKITSPLRGVVYQVSLANPSTIALKATRQGQGKLYWFANNALIGYVEANAGYAWQPPRAGRYQLRAIDENGLADTREVVVEFMP